MQWRNPSVFAETVLCPNAACAMIVLDYNLIRLLRSSTSRDSQKLAGLLFLAILIGHHLAHMLEFQSTQGDQLRAADDDDPIETPPGVTCREAGTVWETHVFGGQVYPICEAENLLLHIQGLCIKSSAWNFKMMKINEDWIHQLFSESHWTTAQHPLQPPTDIYAQNALLSDELIDEQYSSL
ncbi:hypothetical protein VTN02DRAFT_5274 [Thermoascus thermophilus]